MYMNLTQLLSYIENHEGTILLEDTATPPEDYGTYLFKRVTYEKSANIADSANICIIVKDRGLPGETAYVKGDFPAYLRPTTFRDDVISKIQTYISTHPELEYYEIIKIDENEKIAELVGYTYDSINDNSTTIRYIAYDKDGTTTFRMLV